MEDEEIAECVAGVVGRPSRGATVEPLSGNQGLIVCRVRVPGAGSYIFKAVREARRREMAVSACVARAAPGLAPPVIACEEDTHRGLYWMITRDVGARRLSDQPTFEHYVAAATALASLQMATLSEVDGCRRTGVPVVGAPEWEEIALRTLEAAQQRGRMLPGDLDMLEEIVWRVSDLALDTLTLPMAIVHGDLHAGNITISGSEPSTVCLIDWGSAYVGAAFLGIAELLWPAVPYLRPDEMLRVRAAYLRAWTPLLGKTGRLERAALACQALVRLELVEEALLRPAATALETPFAAANAVRRLQESWRVWERALHA